MARCTSTGLRTWLFEANTLLHAELPSALAALTRPAAASIRLTRSWLCFLGPTPKTSPACMRVGGASLLEPSLGRCRTFTIPDCTRKMQSPGSMPGSACGGWRMGPKGM